MIGYVCGMLMWILTLSILSRMGMTEIGMWRAKALSESYR